MSKMFPRGCTIFNRDLTWPQANVIDTGNYCCADCGYKKTCQRPCKNSPERCGLIRQKVTKKKG